MKGYGGSIGRSDRFCHPRDDRAWRAISWTDHRAVLKGDSDPLMSSFQSFVSLLHPSMLQQLNMNISDNAQHVLGAAACLVVAGVIVGLTYPSQRLAFLSHLPLPLGDFGGTLCSLFPKSKVLHFTHCLLFNADCVLSSIRSFLTVAGWIDEYGPLITIRSALSLSAVTKSVLPH